MQARVDVSPSGLRMSIIDLTVPAPTEQIVKVTFTCCFDFKISDQQDLDVLMRRVCKELKAVAKPEKLAFRSWQGQVIEESETTVTATWRRG